METVLTYHDANKPVTIQCDSSDKCLGCTILQDGKPIAFASTVLSPAQERYAVVEKKFWQLALLPRNSAHIFLAKMMSQ